MSQAYQSHILMFSGKSGFAENLLEEVTDAFGSARFWKASLRMTRERWVPASQFVSAVVRGGTTFEQEVMPLVEEYRWLQSTSLKKPAMLSQEAQRMEARFSGILPCYRQRRRNLELESEKMDDSPLWEFALYAIIVSVLMGFVVGMFTMYGLMIAETPVPSLPFWCGVCATLSVLFLHCLGLPAHFDERRWWREQTGKDLARVRVMETALPETVLKEVQLLDWALSPLPSKKRPAGLVLYTRRGLPVGG